MHTTQSKDLPSLPKDWQAILKNTPNGPHTQAISDFLAKENQDGKIIYPPASKIFAAINAVKFNQVKVIILGQDPYHNPGQAHGLSFSVPSGIKQPPSLKNILKEIQRDLKIISSTSGDLTPWTTQGVLLLNTTLTVQAHHPASHQNKGWQSFTDAIIQQLSTQRQNLVFMLWGKHAQKKGAKIDPKKHLLLTTTHPSPLAAYRGFLGCAHFSKANQYLIQQGLTPINWQI